MPERHSQPGDSLSTEDYTYPLELLAEREKLLSKYRTAKDVAAAYDGCEGVTVRHLRGQRLHAESSRRGGRVPAAGPYSHGYRVQIVRQRRIRERLKDLEYTALADVFGFAHRSVIAAIDKHRIATGGGVRQAHEGRREQHDWAPQKEPIKRRYSVRGKQMQPEVREALINAQVEYHTLAIEIATQKASTWRMLRGMETLERKSHEWWALQAKIRDKVAHTDQLEARQTQTSPQTVADRLGRARNAIHNLYRRYAA
tara:strand:+ start:21431 stop:22198 length:768 start_codon:yes stop_codon:yes gene_type:complete